MKIVLASQSPRRHELLSMMESNMKSSPVSAKKIQERNPADMVCKLSALKAKQVALIQQKIGELSCNRRRYGCLL